MKTLFIHCKDADKLLGQNPDNNKPINGVVTIRWLLEMYNSHRLVTDNPIYQRFFVASLIWCQGIMRTILDINQNVSVGLLHLRVLRSANQNTYEAVDGQQRSTSIISFLKKKFSLSKSLVIDVGFGKIDISNYNIDKLKKNYPETYEKILDHEILVHWYENLTDQAACELFKKLNNNTPVTTQEKRNATWGYFSDYIRALVNALNPHKLFGLTRVGNKKKLTLINLPVSNRMEAEQYASELLYLFENGWRNGVSQKGHSDWVTHIQQPGMPCAKPEYATEPQNKYEFNKYKKRWDDFLKFCTLVAKEVPDKKRTAFTPMVSTIVFLYGYELKNKNNGNLDVRKYVHKFFDIYDRWSDVRKRLWVKHNMPIKNKNGVYKPMPPFDDLFHGKNKNAIAAITYVLDLELKKDRPGFGLVTIDSRKTFTKKDILKKWNEQDRKCVYTGELLDEKHIVGDHYIPRSRSGSTTYDNLVVTSQQVNQDKGAMGGDEYRAYLNRKNKQAA
jgi:hypothetical protein